MANGARRALIQIKSIGYVCFEERSDFGHGVIPQVIRDLSTHVVRIYFNQELRLEGVVDGEFVDDVELTCTHIAWPSPADFHKSSRMTP